MSVLFDDSVFFYMLKSYFFPYFLMLYFLNLTDSTEIFCTKKSENSP